MTPFILSMVWKGVGLCRPNHPFHICSRWADNFSAAGCRGTEEHPFQHPFLQVRPRRCRAGYPASIYGLWKQ